MAPIVSPVVQKTSTLLIATNSVFLKGQIVYETDTNRHKTGDGTTAYTDLTYCEWIYEIVEAAGTDTYTASFSQDILLGYFNMMRIRVKFTNANTGASTINLSGLGAIAIVKNVSTALAAGDILAGGIYDLTYDGTNFQIIFSGGGGVGISGAGVAGQIAFWTGVSTIAGDTALVWDSATNYLNVNGRIRIGSLVAPTVELDVTGAAIISTSITTPIVIGSSSASGTLTLRATSSATDGNILFETDPTTERARILSTGELLVGRTTLIGTEISTFEKNQNTSTFISISNTTNGTSASSGIYVQNGTEGLSITYRAAAYTVVPAYADAGVIRTDSTVSGGLFFATGGSTPLIFATNDVERFRVLGANGIQMNQTTFSNAFLTIKSLSANNPSILLTDSVTNSGAKVGMLTSAHYTNAEEPMGMITGQVGATLNQLIIGGGFAAVNAPMYIQFYMAANQTTTTGTEVLRFTPEFNFKFGGTANRATTVGSFCIDIFNGTAPVGTLANGISLYSTAGELRVMDAGGTATLLSPHSKEINETGVRYWIYDSIDTQTNTRLVIQMEKMMKFLNNKFGTDFIQEYNNAKN